MESRYALRSIEGVIGFDSRRLEDGRRAVFRHTIFHKRMRFDFFERRDAMYVLGSKLVSASALLSHPRASFQYAAEYVGEIRDSLARVAFPYVARKPAKKDGHEYDKYFDELDELERKNHPPGDGAEVGADGHK